MKHDTLHEEVPSAVIRMSIKSETHLESEEKTLKNMLVEVFFL
jgi:hypothetical protein